MTRADVGGWLFTCNPQQWNIEAALRDGKRIDRWRVQKTYRLSLLQVGDPAALWVTGSTGAQPQPGIWAVGYTTGEFFDDDLDSEYWRDQPVKQDNLFAGLLMWPIPVVPRDRLLAHPATSHLEVLRQAQTQNPSYLTPSEREAIASMVESWPSFT